MSYIVSRQISSYRLLILFLLQVLVIFLFDQSLLRLSVILCFSYHPISSTFFLLSDLLSVFLFQYTGGKSGNSRYMRSLCFLSVLWSLVNSFPAEILSSQCSCSRGFKLHDSNFEHIELNSYLLFQYGHKPEFLGSTISHIYF